MKSNAKLQDCFVQQESRKGKQWGIQVLQASLDRLRYPLKM